MYTKKIITALSVLSLVGCAATGENLRSNVYKAGQVNTAQAARAIKIIAVLPAQIEVDNSEQKKKAQIGGAVLGALAGGLAGDAGGDHAVAIRLDQAGGGVAAGCNGAGQIMYALRHGGLCNRPLHIRRISRITGCFNRHGF